MKNINQQETTSNSLKDVLNKLNELTKLHIQRDEVNKRIDVLESELIDIGGEEARKFIEVNYK